ncbi:hypothetical protein ABW20_dc0110312 [Dactylellina cionopaga]|nr:hypothetical protein ABW20_dc0110312 [Dactylellina cionopaga]
MPKPSRALRKRTGEKERKTLQKLLADGDASAAGSYHDTDYGQPEPSAITTGSEFPWNKNSPIDVQAVIDAFNAADPPPQNIEVGLSTPATGEASYPTIPAKTTLKALINSKSPVGSTLIQQSPIPQKAADILSEAGESLYQKLATTCKDLPWEPKVFTIAGAVSSATTMAIQATRLPGISGEQADLLTKVLSDEISHVDLSSKVGGGLISNLVRAAHRNYKSYKAEFTARIGATDADNEAGATNNTKASTPPSLKATSKAVGDTSTVKHHPPVITYQPSSINQPKIPQSIYSAEKYPFRPIYTQRALNPSNDEIIFRPDGIPLPAITNAFPGIILPSIPIPDELIASFDRDAVSADWTISWPHFVNTLLNESYLCGKQVLLWVQEGKLCWGTLDDPEVLLPDLATMKMAWPRFHRFHETGDDQARDGCDIWDDNALCKACLEEMDYRELEDFAPTMGYPAIKRPVGYKVKLQQKKIKKTKKTGPKPDSSERSLSATADASPQDLIAAGEKLATDVRTLRVDMSKTLSGDRNERQAATTARLLHKLQETKKLEKRADELIKQTNLRSEELLRTGIGSQSSTKEKPRVPKEGMDSNSSTSKPLRKITTRTEDGILMDFDHVQGVFNPRTKPTSAAERQAIAKYMQQPSLVTYQPHGQPEKPISMEMAASILRKEIFPSTSSENRSTKTSVTFTKIPVVKISEHDPKPQESVTRKSVEEKPAAIEKKHSESTPEPGIAPDIRSPPPKKRNANSTPAEIYDKLRMQRLYLSLGIARFVIDAIRDGKRPYFDVSLEGRIEMGYWGDLFPIRCKKREEKRSLDKANSNQNTTKEQEKTVQLCTAPVLRIRDRHIGAGHASQGQATKRIIEIPAAISLHDLFRGVEMENEANIQRQSKEEGKDKKLPKLPGQKDRKTVSFGSERYKILPAEFGGKVYGDIESLAQSLVTAMDMCDEAQTWMTNQNREATIRDALGDECATFGCTLGAHRPIEGGKEGSSGKKDAESSSTTIANTAEKDKSAELKDALSYRKEELLQLLKEIPIGKQVERMGFETHLKEMDNCLKVIQNQWDEVRAVVKKTLKDHPVHS